MTASAIAASPYAEVVLSCDTSRLAPSERNALAPLAKAASIVDEVFIRQLWSGNPALHARVFADASPKGAAARRTLRRHKGPWSLLEDQRALLEGVPPRKPRGAAFYPEDATAGEITAWLAGADDATRRLAGGPVSVIRRTGNGLEAMPYSAAYREPLQRLAGALREAAAITAERSLARFLTSRAEALLTNDYEESEARWLEIDGALDVTIGPYEVYNDELLGRKAAFLAYIGVRDDAASARLEELSQLLWGADFPRPAQPLRLRVVDQLLAAGDAAHGVHATGFTLPNDPAVVALHGTRRVLLKNVQETKFRAITEAIAERVFPPATAARVAFDAVFTHVLAHELMHGDPASAALGELNAPLEEAKADAGGFAAVWSAIERGAVERLDPLSFAASFVASAIRTMRFAGGAHGRAAALQAGRYVRSGAIAFHDGRATVDAQNLARTARCLHREIAVVQRSGDREQAAALLAGSHPIAPQLAGVLAGLHDVPCEIDPVPAEESLR